MASRFDTSALHESVSYGEAKRALPKHERKYITIMVVFVIIMAIIFAVVFSNGSGNNENYTATVLTLALFLPIMGFVYWRQRRHLIRAYKLQRFAERNGMTAIYDTNFPAPKGAISYAGHSHIIMEGLQGRTGRGKPFEVGRMRFTVGRGRGARDYYFVYIQVSFDEDFPHIVLSSKRAKYMGIFRILPYFVPKGRPITLPSMLDQTFALSSPSKDPIASLGQAQSIEPVLVQYADRYSFELSGREVYAYHRGSLNLADEKVLEKIFEYITALDARS